MARNALKSGTTFVTPTPAEHAGSKTVEIAEGGRSDANARGPRQEVPLFTHIFSGEGYSAGYYG